MVHASAAMALCNSALFLALLACVGQSVTASHRSENWHPLRFATAAASQKTASGRTLKVDAFSDTQTSDHETQGYNSKTNANVIGPFGSPDLPPWSMMLAKTVTGLTPDQLSVTYWAPGSYLMSWATGYEQVGVSLTPPRASAIQSVVEFGYSYPSENSTLPNTATGSSLTYDYIFSTVPGFNLLDYASPVIHHTFIKGVPANTTVFYRVGDPRYGWSDVQNFTSLPGGFPFAATVMADSGQTPNTNATLQHALTRRANLVMNIGDLTYADTFQQFGSEVCWLGKQFNKWSQRYNLQPLPLPCKAEPPEIIEASSNYQPKWDSWARLFEPLFSHVPIMQVAGNHEIELQPDNRVFTAYNACYPQPQRPGVLSFNTSAVPANVNGSDNNLYSAAEIPGVATVIMLSSFQPNVTFGGEDDAQLNWLKQRLANVDRSKTPWLVVNFHVPWYTSDPHSYKVNECMRQVYEPLLLEAQVDVVFNGHVHAYEHSYPVANFSRNDCGIVHIVVGSAGNDEGLSATPEGWMDQIAPNTSWCNEDPTTRVWPNYQPQRCFSYQEALPGPYHYCPFSMPNWQAYRDASFGSGTITFFNSTTAVWEFYRNQDGIHTVADRVYLTRTPDKCQHAFKSSHSPASPSSSPQPPSTPPAEGPSAQNTAGTTSMTKAATDSAAASPTSPTPATTSGSGSNTAGSSDSTMSPNPSGSAGAPSPSPMPTDAYAMSSPSPSPAGATSWQ